MCIASSKPRQETFLASLDAGVSDKINEDTTGEKRKRRHASTVANEKLTTSLKRNKSDTSDSLIR